MIIFGLGIAFSHSIPVFGAMSGGSYEIFADTFSNSEDSAAATGGSYNLKSTAGEIGAENISGGTYELRGGFQAMEKGILSLSFSTTSITLGTLSLSAVASSTVSSTVSTDAGSGYSLTFAEDGDLRSGIKTINDVADGSVTAGSEEYGIHTLGGGGMLAEDTAIVDGLEVASSNDAAISEETGIVFSAAISTSSRAGSYSHTITATLSTNP